MTHSDFHYIILKTGKGFQMKQQKVTFADIAKHTNFSKTTISRYFNNPDSLTDASKQKIERALIELGYQENKLAKVLAKGKTEFIGIIIPNLFLHFYAAILEEILATYKENNYKFLVFIGDDNIETEREYIQELLAYNIEGLIVLSHTITSEELAGYNVPVVSIERESQYISSIETDNYLGAIQATGSLIKNNCDILIHINGKLKENIPAYKRVKGFETMCQDSDVEYRIFATDLGSSYHQIQTELQHHFETIEANYQGKRKGIFFANDTYASIFVNILFQKYGHFPEDYRIVGFDDSPIASETIIPLTTIRQDLKAISHTALEVLSQQIEERKKEIISPIQHREIAPKLIKRSTTF